MTVPAVPFWKNLPKKRSIPLMSPCVPEEVPPGLIVGSKQIPASAEGRDLSPVLLDNGLECDTPDCALYIRNVNGPKDEEGMVRGFFPAARGIKTHRYTFEIAIKKDYSLKSVMIFDDLKDPYQMTNIDYTSELELFKSLLGMLEDKLKESDDIWYREGILNKLNL